MTTLKGIKGDQIRYLDQDPVLQGVAGGSWASGGDLNEAKIPGFGVGTGATSGLVGGGYVPPGTANTEVYNGTSWTEVNNLATAFFYGNGFGTAAAAIVAGRDVPAAPKSSAVESWDGTNWSSPGASLNTFKYQSGTAGTQTAGLIFAGLNPLVPTTTAQTESWNGTTFTEVADLNTAKNSMQGGLGIQTAAIAVAGSPATTEEWNGSAWTEIADLNTARNSAAVSGIVTEGLVAGGTGPVANTEFYNGTSWTEVNDLGTARQQLVASGSGNPGSSALAIGGSPLTAATEEWSLQPPASLGLQEGMLWFNSTSQTLKGYGASIPAGTWASGGNVNTGRMSMGTSGQGTQNASIFFGGNVPPYTAATESYNGTAWTEVNDLNTARRELAGFGTQTASIAVNGETTANVSNVESWNGTSWTEIAENTVTRRRPAGAGLQTAGMIFGGYSTTTTGDTELFDGSTWTEVNNLNTARDSLSGTGASSSSAIAFNGNLHPGTISNTVETWDGTSWTEVAEVNTVRITAAGAGIQTSALYMGGNNGPTAYANTEYYNGTTWTEVADLALAVRGQMASGSTSAALSATGYNLPSAPSYVISTEEWNIATQNSTITVS
jgi:hypothetical protein